VSFDVEGISSIESDHYRARRKPRGRGEFPCLVAHADVANAQALRGTLLKQRPKGIFPTVSTKIEPDIPAVGAKEGLGNPLVGIP
jgi:hypothetical protein